MDLPTFESQEHSKQFFLIFWEHAFTHSCMMKAVLCHLYGKDAEPRTVDSKALEVAADIVNTLSYQTISDFEAKYPQYKRESDIFVPKISLKEIVSEAVAEALTAKENGNS